ncbi:ATP-binding protein [Sutterella wadsworthensis]|uniref:ATP-binding protein n=1 Tax=Sutterella wadsworthensis TaxID=40545 RepID=UPI00266C48D0|nr:ATP-binding protein [Sutterella wadsworthensis]
MIATLPDETILIQLGVLTKVDDRICPTLSGLLVAGIFPQRFFPRLEVVFTVYPGVSKAGNEKTGIRYLDSKEIVGSIPDMLVETLAMVQMRMNTGLVLEGALRKDVLEYPLVAVIEAVANALQHRDYSPEGRGTPVEVNLYSDRLEITNPGGIFGSTTIESFGKEGISSIRNEYLTRLLAYAPFESGYVVENKGTGFMVIESSLVQALMPPPKIQNSLTFFKLTFEKRRRTMIEMSNRSWEVIDEAIISELTLRGSCSIKELMAMSGLSRATITNHIRKLVNEGKVEPTENARSPKQRYRLVRNDRD